MICWLQKLHSHDLGLASLNILQDYLTNRKQRTKVDYVYNSWGKTLSGKPQGFMLGPFLFNILMYDIFP